MKSFILSFVFLAVASAACAQVTLNPEHISFIASPDHNAVLTDPDTNISTPILDHYELSAVIPNALGTLMFTQGLGKPTPDATNIISVAIPNPFIALLVKNTVYKAIVASVGSSGSTTSTPSNSFAEAAAPQAASNAKVVK